MSKDKKFDCHHLERFWIDFVQECRFAGREILETGLIVSENEINFSDDFKNYVQFLDSRTATLAHSFLCDNFCRKIWNDGGDFGGVLSDLELLSETRYVSDLRVHLSFYLRQNVYRKHGCKLVLHDGGREIEMWTQSYEEEFKKTKVFHRCSKENALSIQFLRQNGEEEF